MNIEEIANLAPIEAPKKRGSYKEEFNNNMTIKEAFNLVQANEDKFMNKPVGDAGHIIIGFEVLKSVNGNFIVNVIGQDNRSGIPTVKKSLPEWLKDGK